MTIDMVRDVDKVMIYTMRDLNQDTAGTIRNINESGIPGVITRHNRFLAIIFPLAQPGQASAPAGVDSRLIAAVINNMDPDEAAQIRGEKDVDAVLSSAELADQLGVEADVSAARNRELEHPDRPSELADLVHKHHAPARRRGGAARQIRAEVKGRLKRGRTSLGEVLEDAETDELLRTMKVADVLIALPKVGPVKAKNIMMELEIHPARRLGGLGVRQRKALLELFESDQAIKIVGR